MDSKQRNLIFGKELKAARELKKLTQKDLASLIDVHREMVSRWECGLYLPPLGSIDKIVDILKAPTLFDSRMAAGEIDAESILKAREKAKDDKIQEVAISRGCSKQDMETYSLGSQDTKQPSPSEPPIYISVHSGLIIHGCKLPLLLSENYPCLTYPQSFRQPPPKVPRREERDSSWLYGNKGVEYCPLCGKKLPRIINLNDLRMFSKLPVTEEWHRLSVI